VAHYNKVRLHSAIGYVTQADRLAGREKAIWSERTRKMASAAARRHGGGNRGSASAENCRMAEV
jgi:hypothetical protein